MNSTVDVDAPKTREVQFGITGKAHTADGGGKELVQQIVRFSDSRPTPGSWDAVLVQTGRDGCQRPPSGPLRHDARLHAAVEHPRPAEAHPARLQLPERVARPHADETSLVLSERGQH